MKSKTNWRDLFGKAPVQALNFLDLMRVRLLCKTLQVKDLKALKNSLHLKLTNQTPLNIEKLLSQNTWKIKPNNSLNKRTKKMCL